MPHLEEHEVQRLPLNISAVITGHKVARIHVDGGSRVEVIYEHCFLRFDWDVRDRLEEDSIPLVGFNNSVSHPLGKIRLPFTVGVGDHVRTITLTFTVVQVPSKYNAILGRPGIGDLQAHASTPHGALVFQTPKGLAWVKFSYEVVSYVSDGDMTGIPRSLIEHRLNTYIWVQPVKQKKRSMGPSKRRAECEETRKLLKAGIVREVK
ncbi:uncharacterized protein LOC110924909 [Helianthus annuus]|uniref:uncharacterized protein LOC110924909 n=1 Tax=Helianthus annuus TaxID=4232 RepID=UPI000B8F095E|nr:uncharacterized protein LOC110924909 [Helianthus annuus]